MKPNLKPRIVRYFVCKRCGEMHEDEPAKCVECGYRKFHIIKYDLNEVK